MRLSSTHFRNPLPSNYRPEIGVTEELCPKLLYRYLQLVGILCWAIELIRIDILMRLC